MVSVVTRTPGVTPDKFPVRDDWWHVGSGPSLAGLFDDFEHLLDDLVGEGEQCLRHSEVERLGGLQVDCELKLDRLLHGQVRGFGTL